MLISILAVLLGFGLLVWGADLFVMGAAGLAKSLGVSSLLIGLTIVGFGTSAPEILVAIMAASQGNPGLAIGNAIGSNIANIGLILGTTALITPLAVKSDILRKEYPILLIVSIGTFLLLNDGQISRLDGLILLLGLVATLVLLIRIGIYRKDTDPLIQEFEDEIPSDFSIGKSSAYFIAGLVILLLSSRMLVWGAVNIATAMGISDLVIGLTIVAIGTSLPELAASIMSAIKNEPELAIGNVIGSNIYNLLAVLAAPALISPGLVSGEVLLRDMPLMLALTAALYVMGRGFGGPGRINRVEGITLLMAFIVYQTWLLYESTATLVAS